MNPIQYINITAEIFSFIICFILLLCVVTAEYRKEKLNRIFISIVSCHIPLLIVDTAIFILDGSRGQHNFLYRLAYFLSFILGSVLLILFTQYLLTFIRMKITVPKNTVNTSLTAILVCGINIAFIIITQFNGMYYFINRNNIFITGDLYWLSQLSAIICIVLNTGIIFIHRKIFTLRELILLLSYATLPTVALAVQNILEVTVASIDIATTLTLLIFYAGIQSEQAKQLKQKELELTNAHINIMLSQIQPHFIHNTLTTIENFCHTDGKTAAKLVRDFSSYLRKNMDSLMQKELVPFDWELEHTKIYLDIEKLRFEERLNVIYDLQVTHFKLPILTVQPLAENAVCYGVKKKLLGGTVTIATRHLPNGVEITVSDNGPGFDSEQIQNDGRSHVGIQNVRERLMIQCRGTLTVQSEIGKGTVCRIFLPQQGDV